MLYSPKWGGGGPLKVDKEEKVRTMSCWASFGVLTLAMGICAIGALISDNRKIKWRVWDWNEQVIAVLGAFGIVLGTCLVVFGCGGS